MSPHSKKTRPICPVESAPLRLDYVQRDAAFRVAVDLELEVVVAGTFKVKTEMLPDVNVCLRLVTGNSNFEILAYRFENWPHVWIAEVHLNRVAALLAHFKSELTCNCTQCVITGKRMSPDRVKRSQYVQFAASDRSSIAKCENLSLHRKNILAPKEKRRKSCYPPITGMDAKKQLQSHSFALVRVVLNVAPFRGRFVRRMRTACPDHEPGKRCAYPTTAGRHSSAPIQKSCPKAQRLGY
jgi:hypothetical protein